LNEEDDMAEKNASGGSSIVEIFVFLSEYSFRIEPGFAVANGGDVLVIENFTDSDLVLTFPKNILGTPLRIDKKKVARVQLGGHLARGFYPYSAIADIGSGQQLEALGGSGPGVIIRG
jgi:hypothetical protein